MLVNDKYSKLAQPARTYSYSKDGELQYSEYWSSVRSTDDSGFGIGFLPPSLASQAGEALEEGRKLDKKFFAGARKLMAPRCEERAWLKVLQEALAEADWDASYLEDECGRAIERVDHMVNMLECVQDAIKDLPYFIDRIEVGKGRFGTGEEFLVYRAVDALKNLKSAERGGWATHSREDLAYVVKKFLEYRPLGSAREPGPEYVAEDVKDVDDLLQTAALEVIKTISAENDAMSVRKWSLGRANLIKKGIAAAVSESEQEVERLRIAHANAVARVGNVIMRVGVQLHEREQSRFKSMNKWYGMF